MDLLHGFKNFIQQEQLFSKSDLLILAVSGGVDSVVLCDLCAAAGYSFVIAHCNFHLRGEESNRDEAFVQQLANKYQVPVYVQHFNTVEIAARQKLNIQEAARNLRYTWFLELLGELQAEKAANTGHSKIKLCTAHHANDNIETLLMNFFKGTGIRGLQGIAVKSGEDHYLLRPLLFAKKEDLLAYAGLRHLSFVEDSSNTSDKYSRNYIRHQLFPVLQQLFPQVEENLLHNIERFTEIEQLYMQAIQIHQKQLLEYRGQEIHIPVLKLKKASPLTTIVYEIVKPFGFQASQLKGIIELLEAPTGKYISSPTARIIKNRNWLIISPLASQASNYILIEAGVEKIDFPPGSLELAINNNKEIPTDPAFAILDADSLQYPLILRPWKMGDYFYPLGMDKKKKLARFFIDQKLSKTAKEKIWVIEMNKKIIWVVGHRIDNRFKITGHTKNICQVRFIQNGT